jgi:hypothetical protein
MQTTVLQDVDDDDRDDDCGRDRESTTSTVCFKKRFMNIKGHVQCFNCHNVGECTEFYLG